MTVYHQAPTSVSHSSKCKINATLKNIKREKNDIKRILLQLACTVQFKNKTIQIFASKFFSLRENVLYDVIRKTRLNAAEYR